MTSSLKIIVLTDLHMLAEGGTIIGIDPGQRLTTALADISVKHPDAHRLIITGDLAHCGDQDEYRRLSSILAHLRMPVTLLIGNHDRRETFRCVFPHAATDQDGYVQSSVDIAGWRLIGLDTLNGPPYDHDDIHAGRLCEQRLAWLDVALAGARKAMIFMHHPPHRTGFKGMDEIRLRDEAAFFGVLERYGNVRHIFAGHIHRTISGSVRGIPFTILKSPVHQQPMDFATHNTSLSVAEPGAYGIVFASDDSVLVHTEDYTLTPVT